MRLGLVQKGSYKTTEYDNLSGYQLEVNGFCYNFGEIIDEARHRLAYLWDIEYPVELLYKRLHFSEERFFNRMLKSGQYGIFNPYTGAHVCLGLVPQTETYDLVIHELAHEIHFRQGYYSGADEVVQEAVAILAEEEFGKREFSWNPHFTSQQLLHQLDALNGFGNLAFRERWEILSHLKSTQEISYLVNELQDRAEGGHLRSWLGRRCATASHTNTILNELALTTQAYARYNRQLLFNRLAQLEGWLPMSSQEISEVARSLRQLRDLDRRYPQEKLTTLLDLAFAHFN